MAGKASPKKSYGIAELYGESFVAIDNLRRKELLAANPAPNCPHLQSLPALAPLKKGTRSLKCSKKGGVCSIRSFTEADDGQHFGPITTTCPIRFYENGLVFESIGEILLGDKDAKIAKEIPFLMRPPSIDDNEPVNRDVGRIDMVMVNNSNTTLEWCAVELQAVYFSGGEIRKDHPNIHIHSGNGVPMPGANRRPDFRSSGPKRLMPQLQIKVPTLRRWGKKMAVVVDRPFFSALGEMDDVKDVSNCDIAWFVVNYEEEPGNILPKMILDDVRFTTLERAVEGLTAGIPTTLSEFEDKVMKKLKL